MTLSRACHRVKGHETQETLDSRQIIESSLFTIAGVVLESRRSRACPIASGMPGVNRENPKTREMDSPRFSSTRA